MIFGNLKANYEETVREGPCKARIWNQCKKSVQENSLALFS